MTQGTLAVPRCALVPTPAVRRARVPGSGGMITNVRLCSVDTHGRRGVVFRSMDVSRLVPVLLGHLGFRLPYRLVPRSRIVVRGRPTVPEPAEPEHFLSTR